MEARTTLPLDILIYIIELLAGGTDGNIKPLQILSQACKSMVPLCRKHLFSSLQLRNKEKSRCFSDLLSKNPDIAHYARSLNYVVDNPIGDHELNVLHILKEHALLQSISLRSPAGFDWNNFPESIKSSLVLLIQLPTVTHLCFESFQGFPAIALSHCSNLTSLQLERFEMTPPEVNQIISRNKIPTPVLLYIKEKAYNGLATLLNSASLHTGPIVDFSRLQEAFFIADSSGNISDMNELIKVTTQLQYLYLSLNWPVALVGLGASLASNPYRMLKLLALKITIRLGDTHDPLCGLNRELKFIARNNVLEELELNVMLQPGASCRTESEDWSAFDLVLTETDAFPMLHRVFVEIWWYSYGMSLDEDAVLESLTEDNFPRVVESEAVAFYFSADIHYISL